MMDGLLQMLNFLSLILQESYETMRVALLSQCTLGYFGQHSMGNFQENSLLQAF